MKQSVGSGISLKNREVRQLTDSNGDSFWQCWGCTAWYTVFYQYAITIPRSPYLLLTMGSFTPLTARLGSTAPHLEPSWAELCDCLHAQGITGAMQLPKLDPMKTLLARDAHSWSLPPCCEEFQTSRGGCFIRGSRM